MSIARVFYYVDYLFIGYHKPCYSRFTHKIRLERAQKRLQDQPSTETDDAPPAKISRVTRQRDRPAMDGDEATERRNVHVLPRLCILCKKAEKFTKDRSNAETETRTTG